MVFSFVFGFSDVILIGFFDDMNLKIIKVLVFVVMMEFKFVSMRCNMSDFFVFLFIGMGSSEKGWKCDVVRVVYRLFWVKFCEFSLVVLWL